MADYIYCNTSAESRFTVYNPTEVARAFQMLGFDETYADVNKDGNGKVFIGGYDQLLTEEDLYVVLNKADNTVIGAYCSVNYYDMQEYLENNILSNSEISTYNIEDYIEINAWEYLQSKLVNDTDYVFIAECGHEKLRYCQGVGILITKKFIKSFSLLSTCINLLKENGIEV